MKKTRSKARLLTTFCAVIAIAISCGAFGFIRSTAYAEDAAAVRIDFTDDTLYTASGTVTTGKNGATLSSSSSIATKEKFTYFLLYIDVSTDSGNIEVSFGDNYSVKFTSENVIETTLEKTGGEREFDYGDFKDGGIVSVEAIGDTVTVGVSARVAPEEFLYMPVGVYSAENTLGEIALAVSGGSATVRYVNVFSLSGTVDIAPDDYDENDGKYPVKPAPDGATEKPASNDDDMPGWAIALIVIGSVAVVAGAAVGAAFIVKSKKRGKEKKQDDQ